MSFDPSPRPIDTAPKRLNTAPNKRKKKPQPKPQPQLITLPPALAGTNPLPAPPKPKVPDVDAIRIRTILRRQGLLKTIGLYKGEVDGIWGPQAQHAWSVYVYRSRHHMPLGGPVATPKQIDRVAKADVQKIHTDHVRTAAKAAREVKLEGALGQTAKNPGQVAERRARDEARAALAFSQKRVERDAELIRSGQRDFLRHMDVNHFTRVITNRAVRWDWTNERDLRVVKDWLADHGHPVAAPDHDVVSEHGGSHRSEASRINDALISAIHDEQTRERDRAVKQLTDEFYGSGHLRAGEPVPSWWPKTSADERVPAPGELLKTLQRGGFLADTLYRGLIDHSNAPSLAFQTWRDQQLRKFAAQLDPFQKPVFLQGKTNTVQQVVYLLNRSAVVIPDEKQRREFQAQVNTLFDSRDFSDFSRRIGWALRIADNQYTRAQAEKAKHKPWWGKALEASAAPGKFLRTAIVADMYMGADLLSDGHLRDRGDYWEWSDQAWHDANPIVRLAGEFLIDPLVYVRPFRLGSSAVRYGLRNPFAYTAAARLGFATRYAGVALGAEKLGAYSFRDGLATGAFRLARDRSAVVNYDAALWHVGAKAAAASMLRRTPVVGHAIALKDDAVEAAHDAVMRASRHFFTDVDTGRFTAKLPEVMKSKVRPTTRTVLDRQLADFTPRLREHLGPIYDQMLKSRTSMFVRATGHELSSIGAAFLGRWMESYRVQAVHQLANSSARDVYQRARRGGPSNTDVDAMIERHRVPGGIRALLSHSLNDADIISFFDKGVNDQRLRDVKAFLKEFRASFGGTAALDNEGAAMLAYQEYRRILDGAGMHFGGGNDPQVREEVAKRLASAKDKMERVFIPALQRALEEDVTALGESLWDEAGSWAFVNGDEARGVQALSRESFSDHNLVEVQNKAFDQPIRFDAALAEMNVQIGVRMARLSRYFARKEAEGSPIPEAAQAAMMKRERDAVEGGFVFGDGRYHVAINQDAVDDLLKELDLPPNTRIEVHVGERDSHGTLGSFNETTKTAHVFVDDDHLRQLAMEATSRQKADFSHALEELHTDTLAHELRHAFQDLHDPSIFDDYVQPIEDFERYRAHPAERDAETFAAEFVKRAPSLFRIVRPASGQAIDARATIKVSDLYARDFLDVQQAMSPDVLTAARPVADAPRGFNLDFLALDPLEAMQNRTVFEELVDRLAWDLGGVHSDQPYTDIANGVNLFGEHIERAAHPADRVIHSTPEEVAKAKEFRESFEGLHVALAAAEQENLPHALLGQYALMSALSQAQSKPLEVAYKAISGFTNVWVFASLPLRPGWVVRNVVDNMAKSLIAGARDPRAYLAPLLSPLLPGAENAARTVFEAGVGQAYEAAKFLDRLFGTEVADHFKVAMEQFWLHKTEQLHRIFQMHGWNVPEEVLDGARFNPFEKQTGFRAIRVTEQDVENISDPELRQLAEKMIARGQDGRLASFRDKVWHVMANVPENYAKKVIYNDTMAKLTREGMNPLDAHLIAWKKVEDTLFDYGKISVLEDNLRVFFPFIQFWRKNTGFWAKSVATKPWLTEEFLNWQRDRDEAHKDWPGWMKRYVNMQDVADAAAFVPGLSWLVDNTELKDAQFDPLSFSSFNTYYRAWKSRNDNLAPEDQGHGFLGSILDAFDSWGLGLNPFIRKPLETAHVADAKSWQTVFPETSLAVALTRKWFGDAVANGVLDYTEGLPLTLMGNAPSAQIAENFNFYVQREMADQRARGEEPDRAKAERKIRSWFYAQNLWGYFGGVYFRKNSPEDFYHAKLQDDVLHNKVDYTTLDESQKLDLALWSAARKMQADPLAFDRYVTALPLIESYFRAPDFDTREQMLVEHPELAHYVGRHSFGPSAYSARYVTRAALYQQGQEYFAISALTQRGRMAFDVKRAATASLITPELQAFWDANDTPEQTREKMVKAELHGYLLDLQRTYFSIPESDHAARQGFLDEHPALADFWLRNDLASDDYTAIVNAQNADLREAYFDIVKAHGKRGFQLAQPFLHDHPFIFEGTSAEARVNAQTGEWLVKGSADYRRAKPYLDHFFQLLNSGKKKAAYHWLDSDLPGAKDVRDFLKKHGKRSAKQRDYLRAKPYLQLYFAMPEKDRGTWLRTDGRGQRIVQWYFRKYAHQSGMTQHGKDYLAVKAVLDRYFAMPKDTRDGWLNGGSPEADRLLAYFKKYGNLHATERAWAKAATKAHLVRDPELRRRVDFWTQYFALTPDKRPGFLHAQAENHGIFIWGALGDGDSHAREMDYIRRAMQLKFTVDGKHHHLSEKQATYSYVKPLLDLYNSLSKEDRKVFAATNPEVAAYFARFGSKHLTGSKKLDQLVEQYFALPPDSFERSKFLKAHPDVQQYFDQHSTAQERAIRNTLNVYFSLPLHERRRYAELHPELAVYFDKRRRERALMSAVNEQLLREDPRFQPFFETADPDLGPSAERMAANLRQAHINRFTPDSLDVRRERTPSR